MSFKVAEMRLQQALIPYLVGDLPHVEMARNVAFGTTGPPAMSDLSPECVPKLSSVSATGTTSL